MSERIYGSQIVKLVKQRCEPYQEFFADKLITIVLFQPPNNLTDKQMFAQYSAAVTSTNQKVKTFKFLGCDVNRQDLPADTSPRKFRAILNHAATNPNTIGIIVQNPVPERKLRVEIAKIPPRLDIDGINETSIFKASATSEAISRLVSGFTESGDRVAVVGSMGFVGRGVVKLLLEENIQLIELDRRKGDTASQIKQAVLNAELVVTATGQANLIQPDYLKPEHKLVIDAAFIPQEDGTILGDISKEAYDIPQYLTPVPGGIGPTQMAVLLERIMKVAKIEIQPWNYQKDILEPLQLERVTSINSLYLQYSQNTETKGLSEAVEIAKNALSEGVSPKQVADMLTLLNAAYQDLVARSGAAQARKIVITKAEAELALPKEDRSSPQQLPKNNQSPGKSR